MRLRIKDEFMGLVITRNLFNIGNVTFDTNTVPEASYENFYNIGFNEFFDEVPGADIKPKKYIGIHVEEPKELVIKSESGAEAKPDKKKTRKNGKQK